LDLSRRAQKGDKTVLPALREALKDPATVDILGGDLAHQAQLSLIAKLAGKNLMFEESLRRKVQLLRGELGGPSPTPLERLVVERVVCCWLHLHHLELTYAQRDSMALDLATYYQRSLDRAQKRYLAAIKALAVLRRLALPVLVAQVNIAQKQQVKVGGPPAAGGQPQPQGKEPAGEADQR
jgi:hypothetical protein